MDARLSTTVEEQEARRIARLRQYHEDLRQRFLCPNVRLTGRDEQALQRQLSEKARLQAEEKREDEQYAAFINSMNARLDDLELQRSEHQSKLNRAYLEDWQQAAEEKRQRELREREEWRDAKLNPNYAELLPASQVWERRKSMQQQQVRGWMEEWTKEKQAREAREKAEEEAYHQHVLRLTKRCSELDDQYHRHEIERKREVMQENIRLAKERAAREAREREEMQQVEQKELEDAMTGEFLTESNRTAKSALGDHRYRTDQFKGEWRVPVGCGSIG